MQRRTIGTRIPMRRKDVAQLPLRTDSDAPDPRGPVQATEGFPPAHPPRKQRVKPLNPMRRGLVRGCSNPRRRGLRERNGANPANVGQRMANERDTGPAEQGTVRQDKASPLRSGRRTLEGNETQEGEANERPNTALDGTGPPAEQHLEGDAHVKRRQQRPEQQWSGHDGRRSARGNARKGTAVVTRCGCEGRASSRGRTRGGEAVDVVIASSRRLETAVGTERDTSQRAETPRTPGSAAGCNKPANRRRRKPARWCETTRSERDVR